jgi:hypothetical protein
VRSPDHSHGRRGRMKIVNEPSGSLGSAVVLRGLFGVGCRLFIFGNPSEKFAIQCLQSHHSTNSDAFAPLSRLSMALPAVFSPNPPK